MADREKVIKGLERCSNSQNCSGCPYFCFNVKCQDDMNKDALELLKEQEKVRFGLWEIFDEDSNSWSCSICGTAQTIIDGSPLDNGWLFCPHCGAKLAEKR